MRPAASRPLPRLSVLSCLAGVACLACLAACGSAAPASAPARASAPASASASASPGAPVLTRAAVHAAVLDGLGVLLQRVDLDEQPVMAAGKFHGFRISGLRDPGFFSGVDLRPGDVVTAVNGMPIERPEQAQSALESLEAARELRVAVERDGQPRELVIAIVDGR